MRRTRAVGWLDGSMASPAYTIKAAYSGSRKAGINVITHIRVRSGQIVALVFAAKLHQLGSVTGIICQAEGS